MKSRLTTTVLALVLTMLSALLDPGHAASGEMAPPAVLANTCFACHGPDGQAKGEIPVLAGKDGAFIQSALKGFRDGSRPATIMNRIAKGYSEAEIAALAEYFEQRKK
ncbi:MAG: c-type cytochrome [Proteobacteria bacterium]|nr:c-type cytochrome [Pseudomonadota bacterium]